MLPKNSANRVIVIKVGTSVIVQNDGRLNFNKIAEILEDISYLINILGYKVVLVSSGAVSAGKNLIIKDRALDTNSQKHLYASVGQPKLISFYSQIASELSLTVSQILVTRSSFANREHYLSLRNTLLCSLDLNIIPIVNDNDVLNKTSSDFSDNDHLAAYLGAMLEANRVVLLTSVDGMLLNFGKSNEILLHSIKHDFDSLFSEAANVQTGTGGMYNKLIATKLLLDIGIPVEIGNGLRIHNLRKIIENESPHSSFIPNSAKKVSGIRRWLCSGAIPQGRLIISEDGAIQLRNADKRRSLLAKGIYQVDGQFKQKDAVALYDESNNFLGIGITKFDSEKIKKILGEENIVVIHADYFYCSDLSFYAQHNRN